MGCWNKTCALTRLPIFSGEETYVFVIEQDNYHKSRCYTSALWRPVILPFGAQYNDYGAGEECDKFTDFVVNSVAKHLIEQEVGENAYHDIAVKRQNFDVDEFFEACHKGRLFTKDWRGKPAQLDFVMMRKASVQYVLDNWKLTQYVGEGKGNRSDDNSKYMPNSYYHYTWADVVAQIPLVVESISNQLKPDPNDESSVMFKKIMGFERFFELHSCNVVEQMLSRYAASRTQYSSVVAPHEAIFELVEMGELDGAAEVLTQLILGLFIDSFMDATRLIWVPACHEGSQGDVDQAYEVLANAILQGVSDRKTMYDEEEE